MTDTALVSTKSDQALWSAAFDVWMATLPANTAKAYRQSWSRVMQFSMKTPRDLERSDVARWVEKMSQDHQAASTVNQRLSGLSSFYKFLIDSYGMKIDNPASGKALRPRRQMWQGAHYLDVQGVRAFLAAINPYTLQGSRDYAIFLTYLFTGRRNSEIRNLRWSDIEASGAETYYHWQGKGKARKDQLPTPVINSIHAYLKINHRLETIQPSDFIFISSVCAQTIESAPLSARQIGRLLNKYTNRAGLQTHFRVHDLRHTAAMLRKQAGDDIETICEFLNQSNINTTRIYLHALEGHADSTWQTIGQMLGIDEGKAERIHKPRIPKRYGIRESGGI